MTDHRMVGSVRTCPFLGKFPLAQSIGPVLCFAQWLDVPDLGGGSLSLCLSAQSTEALVHVAEATSIVPGNVVAEATTLINILYLRMSSTGSHTRSATDRVTAGHAGTQRRLRGATAVRRELVGPGTPGTIDHEVRTIRILHHCRHVHTRRGAPRLQPPRAVFCSPCTVRASRPMP